MTKSEDGGAFRNYGATTGMETEDVFGKQEVDTDVNQQGGSMEGAIGTDGDLDR